MFVKGAIFEDVRDDGLLADRQIRGFFVQAGQGL